MTQLINLAIHLTIVKLNFSIAILHFSAGVEFCYKNTYIWLKFKFNNSGGDNLTLINSLYHLQYDLSGIVEISAYNVFLIHRFCMFDWCFSCCSAILLKFYVLFFILFSALGVLKRNTDGRKPSYNSKCSLTTNVTTKFLLKHYHNIIVM